MANDALLFSTIMFTIGCLTLYVLKSRYFATVERINEQSYVPTDSKKPIEKTYPKWDVNVDSGMFWNSLMTIIIIVTCMCYDYFFLKRNYDLEYTLEHQKEQLIICKEEAEKNLLKELKFKMTSDE